MKQCGGCGKNWGQLDPPPPPPACRTGDTLFTGVWIRHNRILKYHIITICYNMLRKGGAWGDGGLYYTSELTLILSHLSEREDGAVLY